MKKRMFKITALILSAVLLVTGTFYFTLAYLQAKSNPVVNTFTAGKIKLTLTETKVNELGKPLYFDTVGVTTDEVTGEQTPAANDVGTTSLSEGKQTIQVLANNYKLMPGESYVKDPTLTIEEGSEPCYLYLAVYDGVTEQFDDSSFKTIREQLEENGWELLSDEKYDGSSFYPGLDKYLPWSMTGDGSELGSFLSYQMLAQMGYFNSEVPYNVRNGGLKLYYYSGKGQTDQLSGYKVDASKNPVEKDTFDGFAIANTYDNIEKMLPDDAIAKDEGVDLNSVITVAFAVQCNGFTYDDNTEETELDAVKRAWLATFGKLE